MAKKSMIARDLKRQKMILVRGALDFLDARAAVQERLSETFGFGHHFQHRGPHARGEFGVGDAQQLRAGNWRGRLDKRRYPARAAVAVRRPGGAVDPLERHSCDLS